MFPIGVVAPVEGDVTVDVDEWFEDNVDAEGLGFASNDHAIVLRVFGAEGGGEAHGGGFGLRWQASEDAGRAVGHANGGNAETRDSGEISGLTLIGGGIFGGAADESHFFFERHLAEEFVDAGIAGDNWGGLGNCERRAESREKKGCDKSVPAVTTSPCGRDFMGILHRGLPEL